MRVQVAPLHAYLKPGAAIDTLLMTSKQAFLAGMLLKQVRGSYDALAIYMQYFHGGCAEIV